jgi:hypothetical protein
VTRLGILLLLQVGVLAATVAVAIEVFRREQVETRQAPVTTHVELPVVAELPQADAAPLPRGWLSLEQLDVMEGPWRSSDSAVLVALVNRDRARPRTDPDVYWEQPWRLTVEWDQGPVIVCGLYEGVQRANPPYALLPWRLGYCRGRPADPQGPALATRVSILREPGFDGLRLVLGAELDAEIFQVE